MKCEGANFIVCPCSGAVCYVHDALTILPKKHNATKTLLKKPLIPQEDRSFSKATRTFGIKYFDQAQGKIICTIAPVSVFKSAHQKTFYRASVLHMPVTADEEHLPFWATTCMPHTFQAGRGLGKVAQFLGNSV